MIAANTLAWLPTDPRKRRWLAVAMLASLVALITLAIVVPAVMLHRHYDANIARLSRQVSTQTAFNAMRPRLTEKLALLKSRDVRKFFLKGTSAALALAELQELVRSTIESNGGRVVSSVPGNVAKEEGPYRQVATTFNMNANNANLLRLLYTFETKEPYLFIDSIAVTSQAPSGFRPAPGTAEPEMFIQLELHGFALRAASEIAPPADTGTTPGSTTSKPRSADIAAPARGGAT